MPPKLTLEDCQQIAEERGGKCLEEEYINSTTKMLWECSEGHQWKALVGSIKNSKTWCPECAKIKNIERCIKAKLCILDCQNFADSKDGKCLSEEYIDAKTPMLWECSEGHQWYARFSDIKRNHWCQKCYENESYDSLEVCQQFATEKGGKCLSEEYKNCYSKMLWQCSEGHQWKARFTHINHGTWCPECAKIKFLEKTHIIKGKEVVPIHTIKYCQELAEERGGKCLEDEYINMKTPMRWECSKGHQWKARFGNIKTRCTWCPECNKNINIARLLEKKRTIKDCQEIALQKEGKCLEKEYIGNKTKMKWKCKYNHIFEMKYNSVQQGQWCPKCAKNQRIIYSVKDCQAIAKERGGKCLEKQYISVETYMLWECSKGHRWSAIFNQIKNTQTWCPYCSSYRSESLVREFMEIMTDEKFIKCRPKWLNGLELDCYNAKLKIAVEYNGKQHYEHIKFFHKTEEKFIAQIERDIKKRSILKKKGIELIIVPYIYDYRDPSKLGKFLETELLKILTKRGECLGGTWWEILDTSDGMVTFFDTSDPEEVCKDTYENFCNFISMETLELPELEECE